jgi:hypothetical protein
VNIAQKIRNLLGEVHQEAMTPSELLALAAKEPALGSIDLMAHGDSFSPVEKLVRLLLFQCLTDYKSEQIEFRLEDATARTGLRVTSCLQGAKTELYPMHGCLLSPIVVVLCNYASLSYCAKGHVTGKITTRRPTSAWNLESDDLRKGFVLSKTYDKKVV